MQKAHATQVTLAIGDNKDYLVKYGETYRNKVDIIYIDPPYNTHNKDFQYNDKQERSQWSRFIQERLKLSQNFLKETGIIIVSIDDSEHHNMRILLDQVYGAENFISNVVWIGSGSSKVRFSRGGLDYMLIYAKDKKQAPQWWEPKDNAQDILNFVAKQKEKQVTIDEAEFALKKFLKVNQDKYAAGLASYASIDSQWRVFTTASIVNSLDRPNLKYDITDPATGVVYPHPDKGWTLSKATYQALYDKGMIVFAGNRPRKKYFLEDNMTQKPQPIVQESRSKAHSQLEKIIGKNNFRYSKNVSVLKKWFNIVSGNQKDAIIMDFFAGSGSTGQAVLEMNAEDQGTRQVVLMTNNEQEIATTVTLPRLRNIISGDWVSGKQRPLLGLLEIDENLLKVEENGESDEI